MESNNTNRSSAIGKHMSNTLHKIEERRFQEERRDVMKMNKMCAGLVALVAGMALSAGSAFATKGYIGGDPAMMKLVPYYETGDTKATIIGIQNMSTQEMSTMTANQLVADLKGFLAGQVVTTAAVTALVAAGVASSDLTAGTTTLGEDDLNTKALAEKALADAEEKTYTEHLFVMVNVYDSMGMMMDNASATLCLAEHEFGVVVLQGAMDEMGMDSNKMAVLSVMDEEIPAYGYVKVVAENRKFTGCGATAPNTLMTVTLDTPGTGTVRADAVAQSMISTWAIIQDTGTGFFGTEVPTSTFTMNAKVGDDDMAEIACYTTAAQSYNSTTGAAEVANANTGGSFLQSRCGLIPERHENTRADEDNDPSTLAPFAGTTTIPGHAFARYDVGDESMVYVWLAQGMDTDDTMASKRRMLDVTVKCEDGTVMMDEDIDGNMMPFKVAAPGMLTMIDPSMGDLGTATDMCAGDRGVLRITMPNGSAAGMVFTHITQMMGHYRMNFPGYSMASTQTCVMAGGSVIADQRAACM